MRVITLNLNGIRSAAKKGFFEWFKQQNGDVVCLQETKAHLHTLTDDIFHPSGYHLYFHNAIKPGYSGVAIYTRHKPKAINMGLGWPVADDEGRYIEVEFADVTIASLYMPSGSSGPIRQNLKFEFLANYEEKLRSIQRSQRNYIICGDWNIAHKAIDLKNWRGNQKNSGFLPEERAFMDKVFTEWEFTDAFRQLNQEAEQYTWWSNRGQAWAKNVGWRIDYQVINNNLANTVKSVAIYKDQRFSDHAPVIIDYDFVIP